MTQETQELRFMSDKELIEHKKELLVKILQSSSGLVDPKVGPQQRGNIRRRIARINTIMGERNRRGVLKEEKRI